jgi:hypothetical protein
LSEWNGGSVFSRRFAIVLDVVSRCAHFRFFGNAWHENAAFQEIMVFLRACGVLSNRLNMKRSIVWLASYPKSGNTWMRVFLANYIANTSKPLKINEVPKLGNGDSGPELYRAVGGPNVDTMDMATTLSLRDRVLQKIVSNNADVNFVKTHNICGSAYKVNLIPPQLTRQAIYILRNPLDMLVSFSRHFGISHEQAADALAREDHVNLPNETTTFQFLSSWSEHVESWARAPFPVHMVRYEDLIAEPEKYFGGVLKAIGIPVEKERLAKAVKFSDFKELSRQESVAGFVEKSKKSEKFFAKGQAGQWKSDLDPELVSRVRRQHKRVMKKYGYYSV